MHIPNREQVIAAFAASSSRPLLAEMERRYSAWGPLRELVKTWRKSAKNFENGLLLELCAMELENVLDNCHKFKKESADANRPD